jgi:hypothetical protein
MSGGVSDLRRFFKRVARLGVRLRLFFTDITPNCCVAMLRDEAVHVVEHHASSVTWL